MVHKTTVLIALLFVLVSSAFLLLSHIIQKHDRPKDETHPVVHSHGSCSSNTYTDEMHFWNTAAFAVIALSAVTASVA